MQSFLLFLYIHVFRKTVHIHITYILYSQIAALIASFTFIMFFLFFLLAVISHSLGLPTLTRRRDSPFTLDRLCLACSALAASRSQQTDLLRSDRPALFCSCRISRRLQHHRSVSFCK